MLLGGTIGTWFGGVLHDWIAGGGPGAAMKKLGELVKGIFEKILNIGEWLTGGFMKFIKTFLKETAIELPDAGGVRWAATNISKKLGIFDWLKEIDYIEGDQVSKFPNLLQLYNPFKVLPILKKSFFPVKDAVAEGKNIAAEKKAKEEGKEGKKKDDAKDVVSIEDMLDEPPNAKDVPPDPGGGPTTLAELGDNKPSSAAGVDRRTSYDHQNGEGTTAFVPINNVIPVDGSGGSQSSTSSESSGSKDQTIDEILYGSST